MAGEIGPAETAAFNLVPRLQHLLQSVGTRPRGPNKSRRKMEFFDISFDEISVKFLTYDFQQLVVIRGLKLTVLG